MTVKFRFAPISEKAAAARTDIDRMLRRIGCDAIHFIDDIEKCEVRLIFLHNGTRIMLPISARSWTGAFLRLRPWTHDNRMTERHYRENATRQGLAAVSPILKAWVYGQMIAIEGGLISFEQAFLTGIQINSDQTVADVVQGMRLLEASK